MNEPLARLYDLAVRALDEHERRADALRGRLGPVLAAAALGASLLSGPVIGGAHPAGVGGKLAIAVAICGLLLMIAGVARLVGVRRQAVDEIDPQRLTAELTARRSIHSDAVGNPRDAVWTRARGDRRVTSMARRRWTFVEAMEYGRSMPLYDRRGRRLLRRFEWEQLSRWRRWRDILMGWDPPPDRKFPWEEGESREDYC